MLRGIGWIFPPSGMRSSIGGAAQREFLQRRAPRGTRLNSSLVASAIPTWHAKVLESLRPECAER